MASQDKKEGELKLGIALGSGNFLGFSHVGVLKILEENNLKPEYIAGSSIGAIIGACYALNPDAKELEKKLFLLKKFDFIKMIDLSNPKISLISGKKIRNYLERLVEKKSFSDTKIPLRIIASDLVSGEEIIFSRGKLIDAIMASISIPGVFPPIKSGNKILVDGGVLNPTPCNRVKEMGADIVIGVDLTVNKIKAEDTNIFKIIMRSFDILRTKSTGFVLYDKDKEFIIIHPDTEKLQSFKIYETRRFAKEGERVAKKKLEEIRKAIGRE